MVGMEDVEGKPPAGLEPLTGSGEDPMALVVVAQVEQRPKRNRHQRERAQVGQGPHVRLVYLDRQLERLRPLPGQLQHGG